MTTTPARRAGALLIATIIGVSLAACDQDAQPRTLADGASTPRPVLETEAAVAAAERRAGSGTAYERVVQVYKTPTCGCCGDWVDHVEAAGFETEVLDLHDLSGIKQRYGITRDLVSCHTSIVGGYVVEGHVPADLIERLLREKPAIRGIAVPGMPIGSPGMEGPFSERYDVIAFDEDGKRSVYATR